jgi:predicted nucleotidyltransferase
MLKLTPDEQTWLEAYRRVLDERFPGQVEKFIIFGSKARGDARPDSDLDILLVVREGDWHHKDTLAFAGYDLAIGTDAVPSIQIYTVEEWHQLRQRESVFQEVVERDGVMIR